MARSVARSHGLQAASSPGAGPHALTLVEPMGAHTWRAVVDGGVPVAARWLAAATQQPPGHADPEAATVTWPVSADDPGRVSIPDLGPQLVPVLGLARTAGAHWLLSELDDGVPLRRLLALARPTPLQASALLDAVLAALAALHDHGLWHGRVHTNNVHVSPAGLVRVGDWGPSLLAPGPLDGHRQADLAATTRLAGELAAATRLTPRRAGSRQAQLKDAVQRCAAVGLTDAENPSAGLLSDGGERARATAELATIVQALRRSRRTPFIPAPREPSDLAAREVPFEPPPAAPVPLASAGPPVLRLVPRRRGSSMVQAIAILAVLGAAVVAEVGLLGPDIRASWQRLTDAPADEGRDPRDVVGGADVPAPAPAAAGAVTRVAARPLRECSPGRVCDLRILVQVWPDDARRIPVAWTVAVVDTCTGARTTHPGGAAKVSIGADRVDGLTRVRLPEARALAVIAVTVEPAMAASAPVLVPARAGPC